LSLLKRKLLIWQKKTTSTNFEKETLKMLVSKKNHGWLLERHFKLIKDISISKHATQPEFKLMYVHMYIDYIIMYLHI
jgi:hypothetical protein